MQITTIGLDIAKNVFQVHGIDATEKVVVRKQLRRRQVMAFFEVLASASVAKLNRRSTAFFISSIFPSFPSLSNPPVWEGREAVGESDVTGLPSAGE
jgi:hypothetical protein